MVGDHIHDDLETFLVGLCHKFAVELVGAETRVDMVIVAAGISVV